MPDGAILPRSSGRRHATTRALTDAARVRAAAGGLTSFTVDEISAEVGISRRTFFNYFASKDDVVVGIPLERFDAQAAEAFVAGSDAMTTPSRSLLSDLAELTLARWRFLDLAPQSIPSLRQAVQREPRLLVRMVTFGQQNEALDIPLIEAREGMATGDPRARVAAHLVGSIARAAARDFLAPDNSDSYSTVFVRWVAETGDLLATQDTIQAPLDPTPRHDPVPAVPR